MIAVEQSSPVLSRAEFDQFRRLAYEHCGLAIDGSKEVLVSSRLLKVMRKSGIPSFRAYYEHVVADKSQHALTTMIDALTTNYTSFFREPQHFDFFRSTVLPALAARESITVWSAACSTGQEPYSLAMAARDYLGQSASRVHILATDISTRVLATAQEGVYPQQTFEQMNRDLLRKHLLKGQGGSKGLLQFRPEVREMIRFRRMNLTQPFPAGLGPFPLIVCRNVMIYFDVPTQERLIRQFHQHLEPGGYLFVGHSESLNNLQHGLEYVRPAVYRKAGNLAVR